MSCCWKLARDTTAMVALVRVGAAVNISVCSEWERGGGEGRGGKGGGRKKGKREREEHTLGGAIMEANV